MGNCCRRRTAQVQDQDHKSQGSNKRETNAEEEYNEDDERDDYRYSIGHPAYLEYLEQLHEEESSNEETLTREAVRSHFGSTNVRARKR